MLTFSFFLTNILLGVGLAMDAFSVSLANGLSEPKMPWRRIALIAGTFAFFQAIMPLTGWFFVHTVRTHFEKFRVFIPWIALLLLLYVGGKMLFDGIHGEGDNVYSEKLTLPVLFLQGIATSIDALSVGFTIADYNAFLALFAALLIATVTFVICLAGVLLGKRFGTALAGRAQILGGVILVAIGVEIFVSGFFF